MPECANVQVKTVNTCVVGTGAAGYNAACRLAMYCAKDILLVSENRLGGTSRNTGSDKQTYYKLSLCGDSPDSVRSMAETFFEGKAVDGDVALCEASLSVPSFMRLADLGLPFPVNRYGEYAGYKTDHDPRCRATSIGPYTSREMTRALERNAEELGIPFCNHLQVIKVLSDGKRCYGVLCLDNNSTSDKPTYVAIHAKNVIFATGGPAGMYKNSVYPQSQSGSSGLAFEAGVKGQNLTEWQYGLASVNPRWNVSGTYMQVLPRVVSTLPDMSDEREFLMDFFKNPEEMLSKLFLKGYQWPFDVRKVGGGSSIIDILVYLETCKGRRVFLDFMHDPSCGIPFDKLEKEVYDYLFSAGALVPCPVERLSIMNSPAIEFYKDKGVDLYSQMLEISLCAQHNNGGLAVDLWWKTNLDGFFACGEVAGTHGVYRPGGSALNSGQVGSTRCARYIASKSKGLPSDDEAFESILNKSVEEMSRIACMTFSHESNIDEIRDEITSMMSMYGGTIRDENGIIKTLDRVDELLSSFCVIVRYSDISSLRKVYRLRDILISQKCYLTSMLDYVRHGGKSRGSALYHDERGNKPYGFLPDTFTFCVDDGRLDSSIQEMFYDSASGRCFCSWRPVRPLPEEDLFFENVWRQFRENGNIT